MTGDISAALRKDQQLGYTVACPTCGSASVLLLKVFRRVGHQDDHAFVFLDEESELFDCGVEAKGCTEERAGCLVMVWACIEIPGHAWEWRFQQTYVGEYDEELFTVFQVVPLGSFEEYIKQTGMTHA